MMNPLRRQIGAGLDRRFAAITKRLDDMRLELDNVHQDLAATRFVIDGSKPRPVDLTAQVEQLRNETAATAETLARIEARLDDDVRGLLRVLVADDAGNRRRLERLRAEPEYEQPFEDPAPLVSICIPTVAERAETLLRRALPSALGQTYERVEVVIVGDGFDPRTQPRLAAIGDPRVRFGDLTHRIVGTRPDGHWQSATTLPRQEARRLAHGLWITDLDDDDALRPDAVEKLLTHARATRAEVVSGLLERHHPDGTPPDQIAGFPSWALPSWSGLPPDWSGRACTAALWHHGLRFFVRLHATELLDVPGDLFLAMRMARAGVRFAQLRGIVYDYWPGHRRSPPAPTIA